MKTIKSNLINEIEINKSRFICLLKPLNSLEETEIFLKSAYKEYPHATHYCFAYIFDNYKKCSDNGEPTGTAGIPILNVLEQNKLNRVICIVIRYFGGIKLGAGGLVRAYTKSVTSTIDNIIDLIPAYQITLTFSYDNSKKIDYLLKEYPILLKEFTDFIIYKIKIPKSDFNILNKKLKNLIINIQIETETFL